ncbi:HGxxPAAW family protein [Actinocorallia populi]|uniref:HGxxPAAW family protein n=1 Tax=Actinocorallia populi TaxID=2079200 RepID=UPI000D0871E4|nr:HGxxPAAW family protein [Actinocorallia populi]
MSGSGGSHAGAFKSWVAVAIIFIGFTVGGLGLPLGIWPMFWAGTAIVAVGGVVALYVRIMADVVVAVPPQA